MKKNNGKEARGKEMSKKGKWRKMIQEPREKIGRMKGDIKRLEMKVYDRTIS